MLYIVWHKFFQLNFLIMGDIVHVAITKIALDCMRLHRL